MRLCGVMNWKAGVLIAAALGCGGTQDGGGPVVTHPSDPLVGTWALTSGSCVVGHTFTADAQYENDLVCQTANGSFGLQAETGSYTATPSRITFTVAKDTCPPPAKAYYVDYSIQAGRLSLVYSDGVEALVPYTPSGTAAAAFGCWSMGVFTPGPPAPVP